ncbi:MAG: hypothetical protein WA755_13385 [Candidatus Acidiferrales bacterium]
MKTALLLATILAFTASSYGQNTDPASQHASVTANERAPAAPAAATGDARSEAHDSGFRHIRGDVAIDPNWTVATNSASNEGRTFSAAPSVAGNDGSFEPSTYVKWRQAVALGQRHNGNAKTPRPAMGATTSVVSAAESTREQRAQTGKPKVVLHQDANGNAVATSPTH